MKKVLVQVSSSLNCGAPGRIVEQIGLLAQKRGWDCYVVHGLKYSNPSKLKTIPVESSWGEKVHTVRSLLLDNHGLNSISATKKLIEKLRLIKPNIVHIHNLHGYFLNYMVLFDYLKEINVPIVWTLHDCWAFTGHCAYFDFIGCDKWKYGCENCTAKKTYPRSFFLSQSSRNYQVKKECFTGIEHHITLVPVSNWIESFLQDSFLKNCKVHTIHNGVDITLFRPCSEEEKKRLLEKHQLEGKFVVLGCAAPWHERKGYSDFYKLRESLPMNVALIMVGLNPKQKVQAEKAGIIGIMRTESQTELAGYYSIADVFINPTYEDNFPTTNLEALACGTPVITYQTGGSPEAIDEHTGLVIPRGDVLALKEAILTIHSVGKLHFITACRERAVRLYNKQERFEEYIRLYEHLLNGKVS